jgi:hypothetical protein
MPLKKALSTKKDGHILEEEDMRRKKLSVVAVSLLAAALYGCGSSESGGDQTIGQPTANEGAVSGVEVTLPDNSQDVLLSTERDAEGNPTGNTTTLAAVTQKDPTQAITVIGDDQCINCHQGLSFSEQLVADYLQGIHVIHSSHITEEEARTEGCYVCHDPITDGPLIEKYIDPADVPAGGLAAVTCQVCHGAGGQHYGTGPIPNPSPQAIVCGECHDQQWTSQIEVPLSPGGTTTETLTEITASHLQFHPEGFPIYSDWSTSKHAESINPIVIVDDDPTSVRTPCARCHTDQGGRLYKGIDTVAGLGAVQPVTDALPVQCRTCHNAHGPDSLLMPATDASSEYSTCTNCHQGDNAVPLSEGEQNISFQGETVSYSTTATLQEQIIEHADRFDHFISFNHYDDPRTSFQSSELPEDDPNFAPNIIEGFIVKQASDRSCRDCHNVHSANIEGSKNEQWAESAHGGRIATVKDDAATAFVEANPDLQTTAAESRAVKAAGVGETGDAWRHYDWDDTNGVDPTGSARGACQRCHTSTGLMNYLEAAINGTEYDYLNNDFSHLVGWTPDPENGGDLTSSGQNEMLFCWGCHESAISGQLRNPGSLTLDFNYLVGTQQLTPDNPGEPVVLPDKGKSNVCAACHSGRGNDTSIRESYANNSLSSRFAGHHAPTAGSLYAAVTHTGFEFTSNGESLDYTPSPNYQHPNIETNGDSPETGDGPCVGCHMSGTANHTFDSVEVDAATGEITTITNQALCINCHGMTPEFLNGLKAEFENAVLLFNDYATNTITNYKGIDITAEANRTTEILSLNDYGAFQDLLYVTEGGEPCIYVHNDTYGKRLIFDCIDWLDNGVLDGTITIDVEGYPGAVAWLGGDPTTGVTSRDNIPDSGPFKTSTP